MTNQRTLNLYLRSWSAFFLALVALSHALWILYRPFPTIPFFDELVSVPSLVDHVLLGIMVCGLLFVFFDREKCNQIGLLLFLFGCCGSVALSQHRLQPWVLQGIFIASICAFGSRRPTHTAGTLKALRLFACSIYAFSAISKFDYQFCHSVGRQMIEQLHVLNPFLESLGDRAWLLVVAMPMAELLMAVLLFFRRTRFQGAILGIIMHLLLLLILGPFGLQNAWPVLIWNVFFIFQLVFLFILPARSQPQKEEQTERVERSVHVESSLSTLQFLLIAAFLVIPVLSYFDRSDHWAGWKVYAPNNSRARLFTFDPPDEMSQWLIETEGTRLSEFSVANWSLECLGVPVYPEGRFQFAVAAALIEQYSLEERARVVLESKSSARTGERKTIKMTQPDEFVRAHERFKFGTKARKLR